MLNDESLPSKPRYVEPIKNDDTFQTWIARFTDKETGSGVSQRRIATVCKCTPQTVNQWIIQGTNPKPDKLRRLSAWTEIPLEELQKLVFRSMRSEVETQIVAVSMDSFSSNDLAVPSLLTAIDKLQATIEQLRRDLKQQEKKTEK